MNSNSVSYSGAGLHNTADIERKESPASAALDQHANAVSDLQDLLRTLEQQLSPILVPAQPEQASDTSSIRTGSPIPLIDKIMGQTARVRALSELCSDLIQRIGI